MTHPGIFSYFIIPNGYHVATGTQRFSICFEINDSHAVFSEGSSAEVTRNWKEKVAQFPAQLEAATRKLQAKMIRLGREHVANIGSKQKN